MSRYSLRQIKAVLAGNMEEFFAAVPHPGSTAQAKAPEAPPAPAASATTEPAAKPKCFWDFVLDRMKAGLPKAKAMRDVAISHPDAHAAYLQAHNHEVKERQQREREKVADARNALRRLSIR